MDVLRLAGERVYRIQQTKQNLLSLQYQKRQTALALSKEKKISQVHFRLK